jgi:hypothetical protein
VGGNRSVHVGGDGGVVVVARRDNSREEAIQGS